MSLTSRLPRTLLRVMPPADPSSITEGPLPRAVWGLAWPTVVTNILLSATGLINVIFVGRLGKDAIATVGQSEQILFLLMSIVTSISVGSSALVARFIGADEPIQAMTAARQSYVMGILGGILSSFLLLTCSATVLHGMHAGPTTFTDSLHYLHILAFLQIPIFFLIVSGAALRGIGDTRTSMYIMLFVNAMQIFFDWSLIFGVGIFPRMGVLGGAYSSLISRTVGAIITVIFLLRNPLRPSLFGDWRPSWHWFRRIWAIGLPTAVQQTLRMTGSMLIISILGLLANGTASVATLTVGLRIESIAFMPGFAYSMAAVTMVGQNLGAEQPKRAERAAWVCAWQAMSMMGLAGLCFILFPHWIIHLFTHDPEVVPLGVVYLLANGTAQPILSLGIALSGALQGAGETRWPAWITFFTMWLFRVPLTWYFSFFLGWGTMAAWGVMAATNITYGILITAIFKRGKWKLRKV